MATPFQSTGYLGNPLVTNAVTGIVNAGAAAAAQPYPQYTAQAAKQYANFVPQLVASQTPYQVNAAQGLGSLQGYNNDFTNQAMQYAQQAATPINFQRVGAEQINQYMSPYINNVANAAMANIKETNAQQQQQNMGNAISKGAFGGDRAGIAQAQLAREQNLSNNATLANIYNTGYGTALGEANVQQQQGTAAQLYNKQLANAAAAQAENIGTQSQTAQIQQLQAQYNMGAAQQAQHQNELTAGYQQYLNANQFPYNQLNWYANLISGAPAALGGQTVASIPQPSTVSAITGALPALAGMNLGGLFGGSTSSGQKRGGGIRPTFATGGRPTYANAGAVPFYTPPAPASIIGSNLNMSNDPVQAYNDYVNASRSNKANIADLNSLYNNMLNAQRGNSSSGDYPASTGGIGAGAYPVAPMSGLTAAQVQTIANSPQPTAQSIANSSKSSSAAGMIPLGVAAIGLLSKLFGGKGGGGDGKGSGSTFNKPSTASTEQQDALNNKAEQVNDDMILLQDARQKNQISAQEFSQKYDVLNKEFSDLQSKGAKIEPRDKGEDIATAAEDIRANRAQASGVAPAAGAATAPATNAPAATTYQKSPFNPEDLANQGVQKKAEAGVSPVSVAGDGSLPVSMVAPENAVDFAKNNGLTNASAEELQAAGMNPDAVKAVLAYQSSPEAVRSLDQGEMAMQPVSLQTQPAIGNATGNVADPAVQQYINMGFTPAEAQAAVAANTSVADKQAAPADKQAALAVNPADAIAKLEEQKANYQSVLGPKPDESYPGQLSQSTIEAINGTYVEKYDKKYHLVNPVPASEMQAVKEWAAQNGYGNVNPANNPDLLNSTSPRADAYQNSLTDYRQKINDSIQNYGNAYSTNDTGYKYQDITNMPLVESQGQWLNDMPTIESLNTYNQNQLSNLSQAPNELKDLSSTVGDSNPAVPYQPQDTSPYQPQETTPYQPPEVTPYQPPDTSFTYPDASSSIDTSSSSSSYFAPVDFFGFNRGGGIHQYVPEFHHGGFVHRARRFRALGGPMAPQFGVQPISMNYGMDTQDTLKQHAQSAVGAGVSPISEGQEALASGYYMGNQ